MSVYEKLSAIQSQLIAPKGRNNAYGGFKYRSCEDILKAIKPYLAKYSVSITLSDEIETVGDRFYIHSYATLHDAETSINIITSGYAREPLTKKGMDESQVTGAAASYARKMALCGLFAIDDEADADARKPDTAPETKPEVTPAPAPETDAEPGTVPQSLQTTDRDDMLDTLCRYSGTALKVVASKLCKGAKVRKLEDVPDSFIQKSLEKSREARAQLVQKIIDNGVPVTELLAVNKVKELDEIPTQKLLDAVEIASTPIPPQSEANNG